MSPSQKCLTFIATVALMSCSKNYTVDTPAETPPDVPEPRPHSILSVTSDEATLAFKELAYLNPSAGIGRDPSTQDVWSATALLPNLLTTQIEDRQNLKAWLGLQFATDAQSDTGAWVSASARIDADLKFLCIAGHFFLADEVDANGVPKVDAIKQRVLSKELLFDASVSCGAPTAYLLNGVLDAEVLKDSSNLYPAYDRIYQFRIKLNALPDNAVEASFAMGQSNDETRFQLSRLSKINQDISFTTVSVGDKHLAIENQSRSLTYAPSENTLSAAARIYFNRETKRSLFMGGESDWDYSEQNTDGVRRNAFTQYILGGYSKPEGISVSVAATSTHFASLESPQSFGACVNRVTGALVSENGQPCPETAGQSVEIPATATSLSDVSQLSDLNEYCAARYNPNAFVDFDEESFFNSPFGCLKDPFSL